MRWKRNIINIFNAYKSCNNNCKNNTLYLYEIKSCKHYLVFYIYLLIIVLLILSFTRVSFRLNKEKSNMDYCEWVKQQRDMNHNYQANTKQLFLYKFHLQLLVKEISQNCLQLFTIHPQHDYEISNHFHLFQTNLQK